MITENAVPVFLLFGCLAGLAVALLAIARLLNPRQFVGPVQKMPYESGMDPIHDTRRRFDVRFHLIAIAFLVFDVEVLFLYPWAVAAKRPIVTSDSPIVTSDGGAGLGRNLDAAASTSKATAGATISASEPYGLSGAIANGLASDRHIVFAGVAVFFLLLALGFVYDWRKGVFQWR
jgi:NADH-quinone oxidoreductase subunit A